ncbi:MAG: DUF5071 domain-containing protein [Armatimonadetes bacterium]|nr:DUF5071 domain-containing protein [Armatimonadota bacterium]
MRDLLPRDKHDVERARALVSCGYPAILPVLPELMEWMQDMNWPVTHEVIAPILKSIGAPLIPEIRRILQSDDETWKYWILTDTVRHSPETAREMKKDLELIAAQEPANIDEECVREITVEILEALPASDTGES